MQRRALMQATAAFPLAAAAGLARPAVAQPAKSRALRFVPQSSLPTLDPMFSSQVVGNHGFAVFDTLYSMDSNGAARPQMAEGHMTSPDGKLWRIRLRPGLQFHDGAPVRAIDAMVSLQRWARLNAFGKKMAATVAEWRVIDDRDFEIVQHRPFPMLIDAIAQPGSTIAFVLPERLARTDPFTPITEMVGSGPYRFVPDEYVSGSRVVYTRFVGYLPRDEPPDRSTGGKVAHFPRIEWHSIPDASTAHAALVSGEIDWWELPSPDFYAGLGKNPGVLLQIDDPAGKVSFLRLNHLQPPFNDVRVRRAVLAGVRQDDYMQSVLGDDPSLWRICHSQFPCGTPYEVDDQGRSMPASLTVARQLLKDAGYSGSKAIILAPTDNPLVAPYGAVTADLFAKVGLDAELATSDWASVVQRRANRGPVEAGGWSALYSYGSASSLSNPALNYLMPASDEASWFGWWRNPGAEDLSQQWLDAPDETGRQGAGRSLGQLAMTDVATVPLGQWFGRTALRRSITGVLPGPSSYFWNVRPA